MDAGEPEFFVPNQADFFAGFRQFAAVIGPATPHESGPRAGKSVFRHEKQHLRAGHHHPAQLGQTDFGVGQVFRIIRGMRGLNMASGFNDILHPFVAAQKEDLSPGPSNPDLNSSSMS